MQVNGGSNVSVTVYEEREREQRERERGERESRCVYVRKMEKRHAVLVCEMGKNTHTVSPASDE
jgi:hypothetical protein